MRRALCLASLALAACAADPPAPAPAPLAGSVWLLDSLRGAPVTTPVSLNFTDQRVEGVAPCNRYFGAYARAATGDGLSIGPVAATRRACPDLALEDAFLGALTDAAALRIAGATLILLDEDSNEIMRLSRGG